MLQLRSFQKLPSGPIAILNCLLYLSIQSLNRNSMALYHSLCKVKCDFDIIVLSEVWSCNIDLYCNLLVGYNLYYDLPLSGVTVTGGVGIYDKIHYVAHDCSIIKWCKIITNDHYKAGNLLLEGKRSKDNKWFTAGLKCSSHHKSRLYRKWLKSRSALCRWWKSLQILFKALWTSIKKSWNFIL